MKEYLEGDSPRYVGSESHLGKSPYSFKFVPRPETWKESLLRNCDKYCGQLAPVKRCVGEKYYDKYFTNIVEKYCDKYWGCSSQEMCFLLFLSI